MIEAPLELMLSECSRVSVVPAGVYPTCTPARIEYFSQRTSHWAIWTLVPMR